MVEIKIKKEKIASTAFFFPPHTCIISTKDINMEDEERPRKLPKLDNGETQNSELHREDIGPAMTGALLPTEQDSPRKTLEANGNEKETLLEESTEQTQKLSKNQLKKLRRQEQWEAGREYRKQRRKEKVIAKRERKKASQSETGNGTPDEGEGAAVTRSTEGPRGARRKSTLLPITLVLDCGFDELMLDKERISLGSQLTRCYSDNSRAPYRAHMVVSSFNKLLRHRFETVMRKTHEHWKGVRFMQEDFVQAAEMAREWMKETGAQQGRSKMAGVFADKTDAKPEDGEVVYLSSDSPYTLTELKPYSTYIIGGLVDKNRHKGICYKRACERGIKTAKLPIGDYIQLAGRSVLATNHVVEIMVRWLETRDWGQAFVQAIPSRRDVVLKERAGNSSAGNDEESQKGDEAEAEADITKKSNVGDAEETDSSERAAEAQAEP